MSTATVSPPEKLGIALKLDADPLCIEIDYLGKPSACLRSSNSRVLLPIEESEALDLLGYLFRGTSLDPSFQVPGSTLLQLGQTVFKLNCCPQYAGVIVTLHRMSGTLEEELQARKAAGEDWERVRSAINVKKDNRSWIRRMLSRILPP